MKIRTDFVTNSSSSSFILDFTIKDKNNRTSSSYVSGYSSEYYSNGGDIDCDEAWIDLTSCKDELLDMVNLNNGTIEQIIKTLFDNLSCTICLSDIGKYHPGDNSEDPSRLGICKECGKYVLSNEASWSYNDEYVHKDCVEDYCKIKGSICYPDTIKEWIKNAQSIKCEDVKQITTKHQVECYGDSAIILDTEAFKEVFLPWVEKYQTAETGSERKQIIRQALNHFTPQMIIIDKNGEFKKPVIFSPSESEALQIIHVMLRQIDMSTKDYFNGARITENIVDIEARQAIKKEYFEVHKDDTDFLFFELTPPYYFQAFAHIVKDEKTKEVIKFFSDKKHQYDVFYDEADYVDKKDCNDYYEINIKSNNDSCNPTWFFSNTVRLLDNVNNGSYAYFILGGANGISTIKCYGNAKIVESDEQLYPTQWFTNCPITIDVRLEQKDLLGYFKSPIEVLSEIMKKHLTEELASKFINNQLLEVIGKEKLKSVSLLSDEKTLRFKSSTPITLSTDDIIKLKDLFDNQALNNCMIQFGIGENILFNKENSDYLTIEIELGIFESPKLFKIEHAKS